MLTSQLKEIILHSLDLQLYPNLVFYAEKLLCESPTSEEVKYYLAKGYMGEGKYHKAFQILKHTQSHQCRYLFALICIKLNKFIDAEKALVTEKYYSKGLAIKEIENVIPNGAAGYYLLGIVFEKMSRRSEAFNAYKKSVDIDPFMWCSYERMCKIDPNKVDNNKIYTELNPKILVFNKKFINNTANPINNNFTSNNKQTKDFLLSPDDNTNDINDSISRSNINIKKGKTRAVNNENSNSSDLNKYRTFLDFNNNSNSVNMTPVVHKEEVDYQNLNYNNQIPVKNNINNPFVFSSSPNHVQLEFGSVSMSGNNQKNIANFAGNNNSSGFYITNNNTTNNANSSLTDNSTSKINPFNINISNNSVNMNTSANNSGIINLPNPNANNNNQINNNDIISTPVNIFNNINLNISQHNNNNNLNNSLNSLSNLKNRKKTSGYNQNNLLSNIQISPCNNQPPTFNSPQNAQAANEDNNVNNTSTLVAPTKSSSSFQNICQLLKYYSEIVKKMSLYEMQTAIDLLTRLPKNYIESSSTYSALGRCYFELGNYKECEKFYELCNQKNPSHLEGMEYFSSCLWHLKDQYKCCKLAHSVLDQSQFAPETWIVLGNCFSLQKEHEIAIKFFTRATQISPSFAYAYTLSGHEYVDNENYNLASDCYKKALNYDERHFNAWWGLGHIQLKEQNYNEAIKFFRKAISINSKSAILYFYMATAYLQNRDIGKALHYLLTAEKENNNNPMIKYQISSIYTSQGKLDEALAILLSLDEKMPKEAPIHIAIGKIYQMKKNYAQALNHFNIAIDLDPKDSNTAKSLIERLYSESGNENIFPGNK